VAAPDFTGAVRVGGRPAGPHPLLVAALSAGMLAVAFAVAFAVGNRPARRRGAAEGVNGVWRTWGADGARRRLL